uniref:Uncharacterized protein n=1 Tax=Taeniopygia guttata TaxID=59729 RepID=A0A674HQM2_TAEGU
VLGCLCFGAGVWGNSWAQAIRRAQPPRQLGLQACATAPGARSPLRSLEISLTSVN